MTPAQEREIRDKVSEALGLLRTVVDVQERHGKKLDRLDRRQDQTDLKLVGLTEVPGRLVALERWRYTIAGAYVAAGAVSAFLADWLVTR